MRQAKWGEHDAFAPAGHVEEFAEALLAWAEHLRRPVQRQAAIDFALQWAGTISLRRPGEWLDLLADFERTRAIRAIDAQVAEDAAKPPTEDDPQPTDYP